MSTDHTLVGQMVVDGLLSREDARDHPDRNIVIRALGTKPSTAFDAGQATKPPRPGDRYLLCSDGLYDTVAEDRLAAIVGDASPYEACARLVEAAIVSGATDNVSAIVIAVDELGAEASVTRLGEA